MSERNRQKAVQNLWFVPVGTVVVFMFWNFVFIWLFLDGCFPIELVQLIVGSETYGRVYGRIFMASAGLALIPTLAFVWFFGRHKRATPSDEQ